MKSIRELIQEIRVNNANARHIADTGTINGNLLIELERMIAENFTPKLKQFELNNPFENFLSKEEKEYISNQHKNNKR